MNSKKNQQMKLTQSYQRNGYTHHTILFEFIIGDPLSGMRTRMSFRNMNNLVFLTQIEPKNVEEALQDDGWNMTM